MQGKKIYTPKLFTTFSLLDKIPSDNFYRRLKATLDLQFLYKITKPYYGDCGQKGIDPVVFFKLLLVGYLENITSDRRIIENSKLRLDILYFIDYDIDDELPWHSTLSRTRQRMPEKVFNKVFEKILQMCIAKGMVSGNTQAVDSAIIKANASMDSIEIKSPLVSSQKYLETLKLNNEGESNKSEELEVAEIKKTRIKQNDIKYNRNDPDAKMATKPGKPLMFSYLAQTAVDTSNHVITYAGAFLADKKDSQCLPEIIETVESNLSNGGLNIETILADTNYSSGRNYQYLEEKRIDAFIPLHGKMNFTKDGFAYNKEQDCYTCKNGKNLKYAGVRERSFGGNHTYRNKSSDCKECQLKSECIGNARFKTIAYSIFKEYDERMKAKVESPLGRILARLRMSTVEPVWGSLINYFGLKKISVKGKSSASKVVMMSAAAYNLKKYLKYITKDKVGIKEKQIQELFMCFLEMTNLLLIIRFYNRKYIAIKYQ